MPRGGSRQGKTGQTYQNRSDLNTPKLPIMTATGQPYGVAKQQADAQRAVPLPNTAARPIAVPAGPSQPLPAPPPPQPFDRPTDRPLEPLTHGNPMGPGAGPEVLRPAPPTASGGSLSATIAAIAQASGSSDLQFLAQRAQELGQ